MLFRSLLVEVEAQRALLEDSPEKAQTIKGKIEKIEAKRKELMGEQKKLLASVSEEEEKISRLKAPFMKEPEFAKYEAMLDNGVDLKRLKYNEMRFLRKDLQIIFQDPYSSLNPRMTVGRIIEEGLVTHKFYKAGSKKMQEYVFQVMNSCGLQNYMYNRYPHQFSGGQRQRI